MAGVARQLDEAWYAEAYNYSEEKLTELVRRIVEIANPVRIYAFGSRAMGTARADSDLDIATIVDRMDAEHPRPPVWMARRGLRMIVDLVVFDKESFERIRPWPSTIENEVYTHGIVIYDRAFDQSANRQAIKAFVSRRESVAARA